MKGAFFFFLLMCGIQAHSQYPAYRQLTKFNGLPSNTVYSSAIDCLGYMWLGTENGLVRFDGNTYRLFTHPEMTGRAVSDVQVDQEGRVWCQNFSGQHFYAQNDSLHYAYEFGIAGFYTPILIDAQNTFYVASLKYVFIYNKQLKVVDSCYLGQPIYHPILLNRAFAYTDNEALKQYQNKKLITLNKFLSSIPAESRIHTFSIRGKLFSYAKTANKSNCMYQIYPQNRVVKLPIQLQHSTIQSITVTADSLVWLNTTNGAFVLNKDLQLLTVNQPLFEGKSISGVIQGLDKSYWITSIGEGIFYIPDLNSIQFQLPNETFLHSHRYKKGNLLLSGKSGRIYEYSLGANTLNTFIPSSNRQQVIAMLYDSLADITLVADNELSVYQGKTLVASYKAAIKDLVKVDTKTYAFAASGFIGIISLGESGFVKRWKNKLTKSQQSNQVVFYKIESKADGLRSKSIIGDREGITLFAGTSKGILRVTPTQEQFINNKQGTVIAKNFVWCEDKLFVSSENFGLLTLKENHLDEVSEVRNVIGDQINRIKCIGGSLYLLTEKGTFLYQVATAKFYALLAGSGQTEGDEFLDVEVDNRRLFLSAGNTFKIIPIQTKAYQQAVSKLVINKFFCNYRELPLTSLHQLSNEQNNINISFSIPWLFMNEHLSFYYKINQGDWMPISGNERELNLFALSPGEYRVTIRAQSVSGFLSNEAEVKFTILPAVWERWWFRLFTFGLITTLFYFFYRYRLRKIEEQTRLLSENMRLEANLHKSMLSSIKAQMNPHFIFNALNTIQSYIYLNDKQNASKFLTKFSSLTRKILEMSNEDYISLHDEIAALQLYLELEKMRFEETFMFSIDVDQTLDSSQIRIPSMIIQPYLENAIKHGLLHKDDNRMLKVHFSWSDKNLKVVIDDNGVGRKRSAEINALRADSHRSFSTQANQKRLELLMRSTVKRMVVSYIDKEDEYFKPQGTTVVLLIPVVYTDLVN